jgi:hypothetical protein
VEPAGWKVKTVSHEEGMAGNGGEGHGNPWKVTEEKGGKRRRKKKREGWKGGKKRGRELPCVVCGVGGNEGAEAFCERKEESKRSASDVSIECSRRKKKT